MFKRALPIMALVSIMSSNAVLAEDKAELALVDELIQCAAYYQISSAAIAAMDAPQMQAVGDRLALSSVQAISLAQQYQTTQVVLDKVEATKTQQINSMANASDLAALMSKYKDLCKTVIATPEARLDYWHMATM
jgi:xanthine dehydrogenase iron-sulfur cluster and FAD-binding subunit A